MPKKKTGKTRETRVRYKAENRRKANKIRKMTQEIKRCTKILAKHPESSIHKNIDHLTARIKHWTSK